MTASSSTSVKPLLPLNLTTLPMLRSFTLAFSPQAWAPEATMQTVSDGVLIPRNSLLAEKIPGIRQFTKSATFTFGGSSAKDASPS